MKEFQYTIKDACGIHARPAGLLGVCGVSSDKRDVEEAAIPIG